MTSYLERGKIKYQKLEEVEVNQKELAGLVHDSMYQQWEKRGYAAPVDTLMDCNVLSQKDYEDWRFGKIPYLEKCCTANLGKLSFILHEMRVYAKKCGWKPVSYTHLTLPTIA